MTKFQESQLGGTSRANEARVHGRRKLATMAYVELGQDNGGILLNVSEGGLAVQSALTLTCQDLPEIRFQLPQYRGWIRASGKVAWMSQSKTEAGIQFTGVPQAALAEIRRWVSGEREVEENGDDRRPRSLPSEGRDGKQSGRDVGVDSLRLQDRETVAVPAEDATGQAFRFTDYSMFGPDPRIENLWKEPPAGRSWGGIALVTLLLAACFFVLGAAMGPASLQQWMDRGLAYVWGEKRPAVAQNAAPITNAQGAANANAASGVSGANGEAQPQESQATNSPTQDAAKPSDSTEEASKALTETGQAAGQNNDAAPEKDSMLSGTPGTDRLGESTPKSAVKDATPKLNGAKRGAERYKSGGGLGYIPELRADTSDTSHRSILVSAPEPGSPPLVIGFPNEAVSASTWVAISTRRSIRIAPRSAGTYLRSERVIVGKLITHSDPFYPVEARNKRIEGVVELRATIGQAGGIVNLTAISGPELLATAGMNAVREWRYEPTFVDGDPTETQADITLVFRLP